MSPRTVILALTATGLVAAGGYGVYRIGFDAGMKQAPAAAQASPAQATGPAPGRKILYWHDPMVPGQKFDKPGKSPFMDMPLVPVYADGDTDPGTTAISPRMRQSLGIRTAEVTRDTLAASFEASGNVAYNERDVTVVQARREGFVQRLHVRAPLDPVRKGQPLIELYVPEWVAAQEEYLSARRMTGTRLEALVDGARQRMSLAGMSDEQIRLVEDTAAVHPYATIAAPRSGVVTELGAREGMTVAAGATLFRINGLATVWVNAEVPEKLSAGVRPGDPVQARAAALPGVVFEGRVTAILPEINPATRTVKARMELANPGGRLLPGMFATVSLAPAAHREALFVPSEAVIQTGTRSVVIVAREGGGFAPVDVELGMETGGRTEVRAGLEAGQKVVVSGQFLLDSEANLKSTLARLDAGGDTKAGAGAASTPRPHAGSGTIRALDVKSRRIKIEHGPIASLDWPAMTMEFAVREGALPEGIKPGQRIEFELTETADEFVVTRIVVKP